jgi:5-methyltetrahydrofolate corrinoid/iron sulfur protein methyltransferase
MILIADNLQITRQIVSDAIQHQNPDTLQALVRAMEAAGAEAIDLNTGPLGRDADRQMTFCVETVQAATDLPLLIDTANPEAMKAGLEANRKVVVINGISLEPQKLGSILPLAVAYDVDIIGYLLDERSQMPPNLDERMAIALELLQRCLAAGLRSEQLILDPVVAPLIWQDGLQRNRDLLEIIRRLPQLFDFPVRTVAGLSNLTTGQQALGPKQRLEQTYLSMLASAGLSWVLLDIHHRETVTSAGICRMLLRDDVFAWNTWSMTDSPDDHVGFST